MTKHIIGMALYLLGVICAAVLIVIGAADLAAGDIGDGLYSLAWGVFFAIASGRWAAQQFRAAQAHRSGERPPIVLARPDASFLGLDFEGGAIDDPDDTGWQVVPYSTTRAWTCGIAEADAVQFRGVPGVVSFAEARRMAAALAATADYAEAAQKGGSQ